MTSSRHLLTPEEQSGCYLLGAIMKAAELNIPPRMLACALSEKQAAIGMPNVTGLARSIVTVSVLTGLPLGIAGHLVGRKIQERTAKERELELRRNYYTEAARGLEQGLPQPETV